jgi:hypothetical protein
MANDQSSTPNPAHGHNHPEDETDHCVCDIEIGEDEATDDSALPPAEGGVAPAEDRAAAGAEPRGEV